MQISTAMFLFKITWPAKTIAAQKSKLKLKSYIYLNQALASTAVWNLTQQFYSVIAFSCNKSELQTSLSKKELKKFQQLLLFFSVIFIIAKWKEKTQTHRRVSHKARWTWLPLRLRCHERSPSVPSRMCRAPTVFCLFYEKYLWMNWTPFCCCVVRKLAT